MCEAARGREGRDSELFSLLEKITKKTVSVNQSEIFSDAVFFGTSSPDSLTKDRITKYNLKSSREEVLYV